MSSPSSLKINSSSRLQTEKSTLRPDYAAEEGPAAVRHIQTQAEEDGVFGVPTFVIDGEIFWGREHLPVIEEMLSA